MNVLLSAVPRMALDLQVNGFVDGLIKTFAGLIIGVLVFFLLKAIFVQGKDMDKGNGSGGLIKIIITALGYVLVIGLIVYFAFFYTSIANTAGTVANKGIEVVQSEADKIASNSDPSVTIKAPTTVQPPAGT